MAPPPEGGEPAEEVKSIRVLVVGDPFQFALEKIVGGYTDESGVTVNLESLSYDALNARLVSSFVSGTPDADVITVDQMWNGQYYDNNWVIALDDYIKAEPDVNIKDFIPEVVYSLNTWRGHMITLPIAAYAQGTIYRTDVFDAAGIDAPPSDPEQAGDWTWDKYVEILGKLNGTDMEGTKLFGTVVCGQQPVPIVHMYTQLAASNGVRWFTKFPEADWDFTPTINSPQNVAALNSYKALYDMSPPEAINYVWFDAGTRFSQGDIAMFYWWTPYFYLVKNNGYMTGEKSVIIDKYAIGALPKSADLPQTVSLGGWSLGLPSVATSHDAGWKFIKWATSAAVQKQMGQLPDYNYQFSDFGRLSLYDDADLKGIYPYLGTQLKLMRQGNGKVARPPMPVYTTLEGIYGLQLNQVLNGALTADASLAATDTLFKNVLAGNFLIPYQLESYDDTLENTVKLIDSLAG